MNKTQTHIEKQVLRRSILDWRDRHAAAAISHLNSQLHILFSAIDKEIEDAEFLALLSGGKTFGKEHIEPVLKDWIESEADQILQEAQVDLRKIVTHALQGRGGTLDIDEMVDTNGYFEVAKGALPFAIGIAGLPLFAYLSAGSVISLFTITLSWPVVLVAAAVTALLGFGGGTLLNLRSNLVAKYKDSIHAFIEEQVIGGKNYEASVTYRVQDIISKTAEQILREIEE